MADKLITNAPENDNIYRKISKIIKNDIQIILAGSGDKSSYEKMLSLIATIDPFTNNIIDTINNYIRDYLRTIIQVEGPNSRAKFVELYVVKKNNPNWNGYLFSNSSVRILGTEPHAIGKGFHAIKPHLSVNTFSKTVDDAVFFGFHLMKYASIGFDREIGDPETIGCDYVIFDNNSDIPEEHFDFVPPMINLDRMLYRFEG